MGKTLRAIPYCYHRRPKMAKQVAMLAEDGLFRGGKKAVQDEWNDTRPNWDGFTPCNHIQALLNKGYSVPQAIQRVRSRYRGKMNVSYAKLLEYADSAIWMAEWEHQSMRKIDREKAEAVRKAKKDACDAEIQAARAHHQSVIERLTKVWLDGRLLTCTARIDNWLTRKVAEINQKYWG